MKGKVTIILIATIFSLGFVLSNAYATEPMSRTWKTYEVSGMLSECLETPQGAYLGTISDFVADSNGRIEFAIVQVGFPEVSGESKLVAVPFSALSRPEGKNYVLNTTREKLVSAPRFNENKDLSNHKFAERVYRYFGLQPEWTEGGYMRSMDPLQLGRGGSRILGG
jgi:PRC-barrel domain